MNNINDMIEEIKERVGIIQQGDPVLAHYLFLTRFEMINMDQNTDLYHKYCELCIYIQEKMKSK